MNDELEERPTSTGMRLRFRGSRSRTARPGLAEARRRLLRQASDAWSAEDRAAVSAFLQERIAAERVGDESGTWLEHLTAALDYRSWHGSRSSAGRTAAGVRRRPGLQRRAGARRDRAAVRRRLLALRGRRTRPHPASSCSTRRSPGWTTTPEPSAWVCSHTFDLDFVMTSEREWGCYPGVPGVGHPQLSRREGIEAVHVSRWEWDGPDEDPGGTAAAPAGRGRRREPPARGHGSAVVSQPDTATDLERLHRLLGDEELHWLVERIRTRLERGLALDGTVALEPATRGAAPRGRPAPGPPRRQRARRCTSPCAPSRRCCAAAGSLPTSPRRSRRSPVRWSTASASRAADTAAWAAAFAAAEQVLERHAALTPWLEWLRGSGLLRPARRWRSRDGAGAGRAGGGRAPPLPAGGQPLSVLAASAAGDEHGLDPGRPLTALVLRAARSSARSRPGTTPSGAGRCGRRSACLPAS